MTRKPLSPEAEAALQAAMRKACERMERAKAERDAEDIRRLADQLGHNV